MNNLIKAIERNTERRKKIKKRIDEAVNLSASDLVEKVLLSARGKDANRLLDEGAIIEGDGSVWGYIKKGTLEKFMNGENEYLDNLSDDFVGYVNIGHLDHATFPFPIGEWRKSDMTLVDIGDGRKGIDMNNSTIDRESVFVKELKRLGIELSESVEANFHIDFEASETMGYPVFDEVFIYGYAVCGDGKNVNSNGLRLKGENNMLKDKELLASEDNALDAIDAEESTESELGTEEIDITAGEEDASETANEATDDTEDDAEDAEDATLSADEAGDADDEEASEDDAIEEDGDEEASEDAGDEDSGDEEGDTLSEALSLIKALKAENAGLKDIISELKKNNRKNAKKLAREKEEKAKFLEATKALSVELLPGEDEAEKLKASEEANLKAEKSYKYGDGIADI